MRLRSLDTLRKLLKTNTKREIQNPKESNIEKEINNFNDDQENLDDVKLSRNGVVTLESEDLEFIEDEGMLSAVELLHQSTSYFMISPNSTLKLIWDIVGFGIIIYQSIVSPYRLWFDVDVIGFFFALETIMDIYFVIDFIINFNTGVYEKGMLIMKRSTAIFIYLRSWFLIDLLSCFPFEYTIEFAVVSDPNSNTNQYSKAPRLLRMLKLIRFLRILRLLRVLKLKKTLYKLEEYLVTETMNMLVDIIKLLVVIFFISHWMAWGFFFIGDYETTYGVDNWLNAFDVIDLDNSDQYIITLYYSFTTIATVGYGDITPQTNYERIYVIFWMLIACGFTAYIIGSIGSIFNRSNLLANEIKLKSFHINQFLIYRDIPNELRLKIMSYLDYLCEHK